jgi:hypothetical protein
MNAVAILVSVLAFFVGGCIQLPEKSIPLGGNGQHYRVLEELLVCGIKRDLRSRDYDFVVLVARPGIGGPEVVKLGVLPSGSVIRVAGLLRRGSGPIGGLQYRVMIHEPASHSWTGRDIRISDAFAFKLYEGRDSSGQPILSRRYFQPIELN